MVDPWLCLGHPASEHRYPGLPRLLLEAVGHLTGYSQSHPIVSLWVVDYIGHRGHLKT